jgi:hypothetical protein
VLGQDFLAVFFAGDFFADDFLAVPDEDFLAADFLAVLDDEDDFFAALVFFAGDFLAVLDDDDEDFLAVDFAGDFLAVDFLAALVVLDADFVAVDLVALALLAVDFAVDFAGDFLAVDFLVVAFLAALAAFLAGAVAFFATPAAAFPGADFLAASAALRAGAVAFWAAGSLGSFLAPETIAFRSAPAVNFGTAVFLARMRSPVRGLRTMRASRICLLKEPKPVMATFSPRATSRVMVSRTLSSACWACLRFPS